MTGRAISRAGVGRGQSLYMQGRNPAAVCAAVRANIRMIYHYFGDKEGLYIAVLEETLSELRKEELKLASITSN